MEKKRFCIINRFKSFKYAFKGISAIVKKEHNFRIHLSAATITVVFGFIYNISAEEWIYLSFAIGIVLISESFNSAVENLCDRISTEKDEKIGKIKDVSAAAVLISALTAVAVGLIIFVPKF